ncbi:MAG: TVP38/TMEM64 family protein [Myxococcales bacterium]|jgi:uncharacterized membrane protein YdjX (TVP38/TMEM64 family)|nr:TVP38/TMEM64 family protein [Myxococcales bacterium]
MESSPSEILISLRRKGSRTNPLRITYDVIEVSHRWIGSSLVNRQTVIRIALVGLVLLVLAIAYQTGVLARFSSIAAAQKTLLGLGAWGYVVFVIAYGALQPFGIPGTIFIFVAPLIWPFGTALCLSMAGTMAASVVGFSFARFVARDWLAPKIPKRFARYSDALERRAFATVLLLRLIFWMPQALHAFLGLSKVPFWTHFWASLLGYVPILTACTYFGPSLLDWIKGRSWQSLLVAAGIVMAVGVWQWRRQTESA